MKKQILITIMMLGSYFANAQKAWIEPDPINPNDSITIWIDLTKCADFGGPVLATTTDDLYMWTWRPKEHPTGHPLNNGTWGESNEALKVQKAGNGVVFFKMIPTEFYEVNAAKLYADGISLLIKKKNGSDDCGGEECKTEDLEIKIDAPTTGPRKLYPFPKEKEKDTLSITPSDVLNIFYDTKLEDNDSLIGKDDLYCVVKARIGAGANDFIYFVDGDNIKAADRDIASAVPQMRMKNIGDGKFRFSFIPKNLFESINTGNQRILSVQYKITRGYIRKQYDWVAESPEYWFNTICE